MPLIYEDSTVCANFAYLFLLLSSDLYRLRNMCKNMENTVSDAKYQKLRNVIILPQYLNSETPHSYKSNFFSAEEPQQ